MNESIRQAQRMIGAGCPVPAATFMLSNHDLKEAALDGYRALMNETPFTQEELRKLRGRQ